MLEVNQAAYLIILQLNQAAYLIILLDRHLISGCRTARNLSQTGALPLPHDIRLFDPERRFVQG